jgi:hypothetical protein
MAKPNPKRLIVEGKDDLRCVIALMEHHINWPDSKDDAPVLIKVARNVHNILDQTYLGTELKASDTEILGIMIDADDKPIDYWRSLRSILKPFIPGLPKLLPSSGLIIDYADSRRFGCWIMPDCVSIGMLETFLSHLVPQANMPLWDHAKDAVRHAERLDAPYRKAHLDKALIHTWLAWQDPPGEKLGIALKSKILDPMAPTAAPFVSWFRELYRL